MPLAITSGGVALLGIGLLVWLFVGDETLAPVKTKIDWAREIARLLEGRYRKV